MISKPVLNKLQKYFKTQKNILAVYLYGSFADGQPNKMSDIDFGIVLKEPFNKSKSLDLQLRYMGEIYDVVKPYIKVQYADAVVLNTAPTLLKQQAISTGKLIFSRDENARADFEFYAISEYENFKHLRDVYFKYLFKRAKNNTFGLTPRMRKIYEQKQTNASNYRRETIKIK